MQVEVTDKPFAGVEADLHAIGLFDGEELPEAYRDLPGAGDVKTRIQEAHPAAPRAPRAAADRRARQARGPGRGAAARGSGAGGEPRPAATRPERSPGRSPSAADDQLAPGARAAAVVEGAVLASYRFDRFKSRDPEDPAPPRLERLLLAAGDDAAAIAEAAEVARVASEAANRARELQGLPSNVVTPELPGRPGPRDRRRPRADHRRGPGPGGDRASAAWAGWRRSPGAAPRSRALIALRYQGGARGRDPGLGREGRDLRHGRDLDQAGAEDGGDEDGHVGRRRRARGRRRDRRARPAAERGRLRSRHREHAQRDGDQARATSSPSSTARRWR